MNKIFITNNAKETKKIGEELVLQSRILVRRTKCPIIALYGDLGSGKTTFVQGLAKGLGIKRRIISPTFIIVRSYKLGDRGQGIGIRNFYHIDLYRIESIDNIKGLGIEEIMENPQNIVAIEWPERMGNLLPKERINIHFEYLGENKRRIIINKSLRHCEERSNLLY